MLIPKGAKDAIFGIVEAFVQDKRPFKVNLSVGAYRDNDGKPWILPSVKKVKPMDNFEYLPIEGLESFRKQACNLAYGHEAAIVQTISGTGALRVGAEFLAKFWGKRVYLSNPTWANHPAIFKTAGFDVSEYRYYNKETKKVDIKGMIEDIHSAPKKSVFLLHACAHNPTGVDLKQNEWMEVLDAIQKNNHFAFFDMAYQGFATGDLERDAYAVRLFAKNNAKMCLAQSFAKNMGLYNMRVGAFSIPHLNVENVESQLKLIIRPMYSNPPAMGAHIAATVMQDKSWLSELKIMSDRIKLMRQLLQQKLGNNWTHITDQIGMFCYTGLNPQQVDTLAKDYAIYLTSDGRISISGLNPTNIDHVAESFSKV